MNYEELANRLKMDTEDIHVRTDCDRKIVVQTAFPFGEESIVWLGNICSGATGQVGTGETTNNEFEPSEAANSPSACRAYVQTEMPFAEEHGD